MSDDVEKMEIEARKLKAEAREAEAIFRKEGIDNAGKGLL